MWLHSHCWMEEIEVDISLQKFMYDTIIYTNIPYSSIKFTCLTFY